VRIRIAHEVEGRERGDARRDPHLLETDREEERPEDVGELRRRQQHGERDARRGGLRRETEREVADET